MERNHIIISQGVCGGKPHISGHRIRVQDIVIFHEKLGLSVDEIILQYPMLTFSDVYAALAYYHDNKKIIDKDITDEHKFSDSFIKQYPSKLKNKLQKTYA
ncbi:hypothetical protein B6I21_02125 [candidate division KSB1 bacterium 4572_119]|nr:MAG: hypothetical protein B6I21_02125 [candidate division KSB1 bacterium 4572_119]